MEQMVNSEIGGDVVDIGENFQAGLEHLAAVKTFNDISKNSPDSRKIIGNIPDPKEKKETNQQEKEKVPLEERLEEIKQPVVESPPKAAPVYSDKDLADSRTAGYEDGYSKGYSAAKSAYEEIDKNICNTLESIKSEIANLSNKQDEAQKYVVSDMANVMKYMTKKILMINKEIYSSQQLENMIQKSLKELFHEPKLNIYVCEDLTERLVSKMETIRAEAGYSGIVDILPDSTMQNGQCRVEWIGGG
ncbi:FliH/SctL family protein, partial [Rickettsiales bacterium]|nr:FliH/SctL family protein [Rickettsiales bacterium]